MKKRRFEWPEHSTWWERNQAKVLVCLLTVGIILLLIVPLIQSVIEDYPIVGLIWVIVLFLDMSIFYLLFPNPTK